MVCPGGRRLERIVDRLVLGIHVVRVILNCTFQEVRPALGPAAAQAGMGAPRVRVAVWGRRVGDVGFMHHEMAVFMQDDIFIPAISGYQGYINVVPGPHDRGRVPLHLEVVVVIPADGRVQVVPGIVGDLILDEPRHAVVRIVHHPGAFVVGPVLEVGFDVGVSAK